MLQGLQTIKFGAILLNAAVLSVLLFLVLPAFIVLPMSLDSSDFLTFPPKHLSIKWYIEFIQNERWLGSLILSFQVAVLTAILSTIIGTMASLALNRGKFFYKTLITSVIISPMIAPLIIIAIAVYGLYAKLGLVGTRLGLVIAHTVLALPYVVLITSTNLHRFDTTLEMAAMSLGAKRIRTFFSITLPLILPGMITGAAFAFIVSFDELVVANFISGVRNVTLPKQMFDGIRFEVSPLVASASSLLIILSIITIGLLNTIKKSK